MKKTAPTKNINLGNKRPETANVKSSPGGRNSRTPGKAFKPDFTEKSAAEDTVDPIYENKDPISASMKMRKDAGSITSVVSGGGKPKFFFQLKLEGAGAEVKGAKKPAAKSNGASGGAKTEKKKAAKDDAGGDPITASIKQRKDAGSYVTVVKNDT